MKIRLGKDVEIDLDKAIESRVLIQANSGGGKSYTIRRFIEQAFGKKQIIVLDPEGEFANLRSKFDFVYAGPGGDAPVETRSAALLARKLLELKASAIIDLYELSPQERKHYVRLFLESMVNAPKELWHDCFVVLDEAHIFAPEKDQSESLGAVIDLASRGRKRGYCLIPATQRPAKLNKDVAAECNNKLIGRASLDIDRKRCAEELGFTTKEQILSLRNLEPGEFYAFGPAIGRDVVKTKIGDVSIPPPKRGVSKGSVPAPSVKVKAILSKLADLPQEAQKEAQTVAELKQEVARLKRSQRTEVAELTEADINAAVKAAEKRKDEQFFSERDEWLRHMNTLFKLIADIGGAAAEFKKAVEKKKAPSKIEPYLVRAPAPKAPPVPVYVAEGAGAGGNVMSKGEIAVLSALAQFSEGTTREHLTVLTTYKRSTRDRYINYLQAKGFVSVSGSTVMATQEGIAALGSEYKPLPTGQALIDHYLSTLPQGEAKILQILIERGTDVARDELTEATGYQRSTRDRYINYLQVRKLVEATGAGMIKASKFLL